MSFLGAFRGVCVRNNALQSHRSLNRFSPLSRNTQPSASRVLTTSPIWRKENSIVKSPAKVEATESLKPETIQKEKPAIPAQQQSLLAEPNVSNKEQRKADWAIIKDMAQYLWPKNDFGTRFRVGLSLALLVGAKVAFAHTLYLIPLQ